MSAWALRIFIAPKPSTTPQPKKRHALPQGKAWRLYSDIVTSHFHKHTMLIHGTQDEEHNKHLRKGENKGIIIANILLKSMEH